MRGGTADTVELTISQAEEVFLSENLELLAAHYHLTAEEAALVGAGLRPNPQLSANVSYVNPFVKPVDYTATQTAYRIDQLIELGGKRGKRIGVAEHSVESAKAEFQGTLRELLSRLRESYLDAAVSAKLYALADTTNRIFTKSRELAAVRFKAGDIGEAELRKLELAQLDVRQDLNDAFQQSNTAESGLRKMLNYSAVAPIRLSYSFHPSTMLPNEDSLAALALTIRPDLVSVHEKRLMAEQQVDLAHANAFPDLMVGVELDRQGPDFRNTLGGGVGIALPIFNRNQDEIQRAEAEAQASEADRKELENAVANDVHSAFKNYRDSWSYMQSLPDSTILSARRVQEMSVASYSSGNAGLIDFLETQRVCASALRSYYAALRKHLENQIELERAVGTDIFKESRQ